MDKLLIRKSLLLQNLSSKQICIHLNNLLLDPRLWEKFSSFHPNNREKIKEHIYKDVLVNLFAMISLKKKLMEHCINLILISIKNTKYRLEHIIKKDDAFCLYCYLFSKMLVIEREISSLMITWLFILKKMWLITLIMKLSYNNFKIWKTCRRKF